MIRRLTNTGVIDELSGLMFASLDQVPADVGCGHVIKVASICVRCPQRGLLCQPCARRHFHHDHDATWRHTCDRCGQVDELIWIPMGVRVQQHRGKVVFVAPEGVGICTPCQHLGTVGFGGVG